MKKNLFFFAAAAIALASCSNDDVVEVNNGTGIGFRASVGSRASEMTIAGLGDFKVTAVYNSAIYFQDVTFTGSSDGTYTSYPEYYWPADGTVSFYAYSPSSLTMTLNGAKDALTLTDFAPAAKMSQQIDFITATATGSKASNETSDVELEFKHNLAQIEVQAVNTNTAYTFKVRGVRIGNVASTGTFNGSSWTTGTEKTNYGQVYNDAVTLDHQATSIMSNSFGNAMLIPQEFTAWDKESNTSGAYIAILVNITTSTTQIYPNTEGEYAWVALPISGTWYAGYKYVYTLDFSEGAGVGALSREAVTAKNRKSRAMAMTTMLTTSLA